MTTKLHITGLTPSVSVGLYAGEPGSFSNNDRIFVEQVFWWSLSKKIDYLGLVTLRVRGARCVVPYLPYETTLDLMNGEDKDCPVTLVRDRVFLAEDISIAPPSFLAGIQQWVEENYSEHTIGGNIYRGGNQIIIKSVGLIQCSMDKIMITSNGKKASVLWEDPSMFDVIKETLNV